MGQDSPSSIQSQQHQNHYLPQLKTSQQPPTPNNARIAKLNHNMNHQQQSSPLYSNHQQIDNLHEYEKHQQKQHLSAKKSQQNESLLQPAFNHQQLDSIDSKINDLKLNDK